MRLAELLVRGATVGHAVHEPADGFDATGDEDVALARLDRVRSHADRFAGVFSIDVLASDAVTQMQRWLDAGLSGLRLFTTGSTMPGQAGWLDDERLADGASLDELVGRIDGILGFAVAGEADTAVSRSRAQPVRDGDGLGTVAHLVPSQRSVSVLTGADGRPVP